MALYKRETYNQQGYAQPSLLRRGDACSPNIGLQLTLTTGYASPDIAPPLSAQTPHSPEEPAHTSR